MLNDVINHTIATLFSLKWVHLNSLNCINHIMEVYFKNESAIILSDTDLDIWLLTVQTRTSFLVQEKLPPQFRNLPVIIIYTDVSTYDGPELYGSVILLTKSLTNISRLWEKYRLLNFIVLLQSEQSLNVYTWFPYEKNKCNENPIMEVIDSWSSNTFVNNINLFPNKIPKQLNGCPLKIAWVDCAPFIDKSDTGIGFSGPEVQTHLILSEAYNFTLQPYPLSSRDWFYGLVLPNGTYGGAIRLLLDRKVDFAGSSLSYLHKGTGIVDKLPPHIQDYIVWILPPPIPLSFTEAYYEGFQIDVWIATFILTLISAILPFLIVPATFGEGILWSLSRLLGVSLVLSKENRIIASFGVLLEMCTLIISTLYRSSILLNLTIIPLYHFNGPKDGFDYGLRTYFRPTQAHLLKSSDFKLWNEMSISKRYDENLYFDYKKIVKDRTHMALGFKFIDQYRIHKAFPGVPYKKLVLEVQEKFLRMDQALMLAPYHPLTSILSEKMEFIIEAGLPSLFMKRYFDKFPQSSGNEDRTPLNLEQIAPVCKILGYSLGICCLIFMFEVISVKIQRTQ